MSANLVSDVPGRIQFENANEGRSYPFADDESLVCSDGTRMPEGILADMKLVVPEGSSARVSSVHVSSGMVSVCVSVATPSGVNALSATVATSSLKPYVPYRMSMLEGSEDVGGAVTFGDFEVPPVPTTYRFTEGARLEDSVVAEYRPAGLRGFLDPRTGEIARGDVQISFSSHIESKMSDTGVSLSLLPGSAELLATDCDRNRPVNVCGSTTVTSINGVEPDDSSRIVIWFH